MLPETKERKLREQAALEIKINREQYARQTRTCPICFKQVRTTTSGRYYRHTIGQPMAEAGKLCPVSNRFVYHNGVVL